MDYEKAYKEALERAYNIKNDNTTGTPQEIAEYIFPEVAESGDERIRKTLIKYFRGSVGLGVAIDGVSVKDMVVWLEKQKESSPDKLIEEYWMGYNSGLTKGKQIAEGEHNTEKLEEWSEEDEEMLDAMIDMVSNSLREPLCPRKGMLAWLKSLRPQPKQEWSKEDDYKKRWIIQLLTTMQEKGIGDKYGDSVPDDIPGIIDWLKSLRPQPHWKPSEHQLEVLKLVAEKDGTCLIGLYNDLKKL